jgi:hypothetical protein
MTETNAQKACRSIGTKQCAAICLQHLPSFADGECPQVGFVWDDTAIAAERRRRPNGPLGDKTMSHVIEMIEVKSSNIYAVGHDGPNLYVRFRNKGGEPGSFYAYDLTRAQHLHSEDHHTAMTRDPHPGKYFHEHIRTVYEGVLISDLQLQDWANQGTEFVTKTLPRRKHFSAPSRIEDVA